MKKVNPPSKKFLVCVKNDGYHASLELRKIYQVVPDSEYEKEGLFKIIDESGEDYLYPMAYFHSIHLTKTEEKILALTG